MGYSSERVKKQLQCHKKLYFIFILEIAIGVTIFISCINIFFGWMDKTEELRREREGKEMTVSYSNVSDWEIGEAREPAIAYSDFNELREKYKSDLELSYGCVDRVTYALNSETLLTFYSFFMDEKMYLDTFGSQMDETCDFIYMGAKAYSKVKQVAERKNKEKKLFLLEGTFFEINKDGTVSLNGFGKFIPQLINNKKDTKQIKHPSDVALEEDNYNVDDCVILPIQFVEKVEADLSGWQILKLKYKSTAGEINKVPALLADLAKAHNGVYIYTVPDKYMNMEEKIDSASFSIEKYFYASVCILTIIMIGMMGVMLLFLHKRRHSIAIGIAYGSTFNRIFWELFTEVFIVFETGGAIGLIVSAIVIPYLKDSANGNNTFHFVSIPIVVVIMGLGAILISLCSVFEINRVNPVEVLKER